MKKLLLSSALAGLLATTNASARDFCSDASQIVIDLGAMGTGIAVASTVGGAVPGLIAGAIANQLLCNPTEKSTVDSDVKHLFKKS